MDIKKIISIIGYAIAGLLVSTASIYYFIYNPEVYDNRRFVESFNVPIEAAQDNPKQLSALKTIQVKGLEWAHYQLVDAIKDGDQELAGLYIDAGMVLKNKAAIMERLIEAPDRWIALIERIGWNNEADLSGLFYVSHHVTTLDSFFEIVHEDYAEPHDMAFKNHYLKFKIILDKWLHEKNLELANVDVMCEGNRRCKIMNVPGIHIEYEKKKPVAPLKDLIIWQDPNLTLMSVAILLKNQSVIDYLASKGVTSRINNMVMSDRMVVVFEIQPNGDITYPEGITVKVN